MKTVTELFNQSFRILFFDEMEEYEITIQRLNERLKSDKNSNGYNNLGLAHFEIGDYDKALVNLNLAIEVNGKNSIAYINRGELNKKWDKISDAEYDYGKAIELTPANVTFWRCRAYLYKENGQLEKALADFKKAKTIEPNFEPTKKEIVEIELKLGVK